MLPVPEASRPRRRDLLAKIGRRDDPLGQRHTIVGKEDDLQRIGHLPVAIDDIRDGVDQANDQLGAGVAEGGLGAKQRDTADRRAQADR